MKIEILTFFRKFDASVWSHGWVVTFSAWIIEVSSIL